MHPEEIKDVPCANCGTPLQGEWCHHCGQPAKSLVRGLSSVLVDIVNTLLIYDSRIWRTLLQLYLRPGFISKEYIAGRQVRYIPPFRLFFVLSLVTFLCLQLLASPQDMFRLGNTTPGETPVQAVPDTADGGPVNFDLENLREEGLTLQLDWLPAAANARLNAWLEQALANVERAGQNPGRLLDAMFNFLPLALFMMMPVFALLLKLLYLFRQRLYMEHLVVALHSHSFLFLGILVSIALGLIAGWAVDLPVLGALLGFLATLSQLWMPAYLLLMQKAVYRQGWPMTLLKYLFLGSLYSSMILFVLVLAVLVSLVNL